MDEAESRPSAALPPLARARLDDLLGEVLTRVGDVLDTQERLRVLLDAVVGLAADLDLDSVLERIVRVSCQLADARYGALGVLGTGPDRRLKQFITHGLTDEQRAAIGDLPRGHGILGVIIDSPEPLRLERLADHPRSYGFPAHHPPMETFLGVPVRIRDQVFGNLYLTEKRSGGGFTVEDEEIVTALAAAAGVVIENARLYEESARRQRWLQAAAEITAALLGRVEREKALELVADRAREVAHADAAVVLLSNEARQLVVEVSSGQAPDAAGSLVPVDGTAVQPVLDDGRTVTLTRATAPAMTWRHSASAPSTAGRRSPTPCCCRCAPTDLPTACSSWAGWTATSSGTTTQSCSRRSPSRLPCRSASSRRRRTRAASLSSRTVTGSRATCTTSSSSGSSRSGSRWRTSPA